MPLTLQDFCKAMGIADDAFITRLVLNLPLKIISEANTPQHWAKKNKRKKAQQLEVMVAMHNALAGRKIQLPCVAKLVRIGPKALDGDNLANGFKGVRDAIAAKLGVDDGNVQKVQFIYDQEPIKVRKYSMRVEINSI